MGTHSMYRWMFHLTHKSKFSQYAYLRSHKLSSLYFYHYSILQSIKDKSIIIYIYTIWSMLYHFSHVQSRFIIFLSKSSYFDHLSKRKCEILLDTLTVFQFFRMTFLVRWPVRYLRSQDQNSVCRLNPALIDLLSSGFCRQRQ